MTLQRKTTLLLAMAALIGLTAGCSGVHASKSVSPLDFLLPGGGGLMRGLLYAPPSELQIPANITVPLPDVPVQPVYVG